MFRGRRLTELAEVPDEVLALSLKHYQAALDGTPGAFEFVSEGLTFAIQALPVRADDDTVESALVIVRDITERTRAEQQIARRCAPAERHRGARALRPGEPRSQRRS